MSELHSQIADDGFHSEARSAPATSTEQRRRSSISIEEVAHPEPRFGADGEDPSRPGEEREDSGDELDLAFDKMLEEALSEAGEGAPGRDADPCPSHPAAPEGDHALLQEAVTRLTRQLERAKEDKLTLEDQLDTLGDEHIELLRKMRTKSSTAGEDEASEHRRRVATLESELGRHATHAQSQDSRIKALTADRSRLGEELMKVETSIRGQYQQLQGESHARAQAETRIAELEEIVLQRDRDLAQARTLGQRNTQGQTNSKRVHELESQLDEQRAEVRIARDIMRSLEESCAQAEQRAAEAKTSLSRARLEKEQLRAMVGRLRRALVNRGETSEMLRVSEHLEDDQAGVPSAASSSSGSRPIAIERIPERLKRGR